MVIGLTTLVFGQGPRFGGPPVAPGDGSTRQAGGARDPLAGLKAALNLTDVLMRRTMVGFGPTLAREQIEPVADLMALRLAWDSTERERQVAIHNSWLRRLASPSG